MESAGQDWKNHLKEMVNFFNDKGIELPAIKDISTLLQEKGLGIESIKYKMANREGLIDAMMGSLWSSIVESQSPGDFLKSSITFLFHLTSIFESVIPYSKELKCFFQIISAFLNLIFNENSDVTKLADKENVDDEVKHDIAGVIEKLSISHTYVSEVNDTDSIEKSAIKIMIANVNIHTGVRFIGNLKSRIESLISCDMDKPQAQKCLLYINLFVRVSLLRKSLLLQMLTALGSTNYSAQTVEAIRKVMEKDNARAKNLLSFLESPTIENSVTLFAFFDFSEQEHVTRFAIELNLKLQDLSSDFLDKELCIQTCTEEKEEYVLSRPTWTRIWGLYRVKRQTNTTNVLFRFEFLPGSQNRFYIRSNDGKYYVWMKTDRFCKCCTEQPGEAGEWIVIRVSESNYLFSPKKWPNQFIYLEKWMFEHVRGLDDKRTYGSVRECLFKLVPPIANSKVKRGARTKPRKKLRRKSTSGENNTSSGGGGALPYSPTPCLKIRNMFDAEMETDRDWEVNVQDAILEKCNGIMGILHIYVDSNSKEGCVYIKCNSCETAYSVYKSLHDWRFDGRLVTVKYLRLEFYHKKFPDSRRALKSLQPSKSNTSSLVLAALPSDYTGDDVIVSTVSKSDDIMPK